jgi:tight adherence protein C
VRPAVLVPRVQPISPRLRALLVRLAPSHWLRDSASRARLLRAGFESDDALVVYAGARVALLLALPALSALVLMGRSIPDLVGAVLFAFVAAWLVPPVVLQWIARRRRERLRLGIADVLDLLVVCVEAGCEIDSAVRLVARDARSEHPELASELGEVVRARRAGIARPEALRSLYTRTGVAELRLIATSIIQSERWGTSVAKGLRACAETLRAKRGQAAERSAWIAPIKMAVVLVSLIVAPLLILGYQLSAGGSR